MPRDQELIKLRNKRIRDVYETMRAKRTNGRPTYTVAYIINEISRKHVFVSPKVIERVLYGEDDR